MINLSKLPKPVKDDADYKKYVQIREGFVWATNAHYAIKIHLADIDTDLAELFSTDEVLYIEHAKLSNLTLKKNETYGRVGNTLNIMLAEDIQRTITLLTEEEYSKKSDSRFPIIENVLEEREPYFRIGFNCEYLGSLQQVFGMFSIHAMGDQNTRQYRLLPHNYTKSFGIIMPVLAEKGGIDYKEVLKTALNINNDELVSNLLNLKEYSKEQVEAALTTVITYLASSKEAVVS